jgi:outer membrane protein assembly factor BamB
MVDGRRADVGSLAAQRNGDWPQWRGRARDGRVKWLPATLPEKPEVIWSADLTSTGIGSVSVGEGCVVVISRDSADEFDVVQCFDAVDGQQKWKHIYEAKGNLDYGNSARAAPLICDGSVYTLGAFGHLYCLELESGLPLWQRNLNEEFSSAQITWGHSGSPLIVDEKLIVQPGGAEASLVALDLDTGETIWQCPGGAASYSSLMPLQIGKRCQVIGFDFDSLGAWEVDTGSRLWRHVPPRRGDFNVPTVLIDSPSENSNRKLIVASENNGTRVFTFNGAGELNQEPLATARVFAPDTHTPVLIRRMVVGVHNALYALNVDDNLGTILELDDPAFESYGSIIASDNRALFLNLDGELLLVSIQENELKIVSRWKLEVEPGSVYSHPAVADEGFYVRLGRRLLKLKLAVEASKN